ncbi:hypothetical protein BC827DRAFT_1271209 [Russula dissimulans]|nr:hypothetical protein BC827DRAFT_1271209 [Russula dissimulans]
MSNIQTPMCAHHPRTRKDVAFSWPELPHPDAIPLHGVSLEGENTRMRRKAEEIVQCKLQTYQAAAVVSTVLAGVESQLLVFFKSSPSFPQQPTPPMLSYLFVLTYVALIFSVSSTISSLVLTRAFGNVTIPVECLRAKIKGMAKPRFRFPLVQTRFGDGDRGPLQRRKWIE